jgi:hypothetical protein
MPFPPSFPRERTDADRWNLFLNVESLILYREHPWTIRYAALIAFWISSSIYETVGTLEEVPPKGLQMYHLNGTIRFCSDASRLAIDEDRT